ncbi:UNVERIFIED_CONTAM: hypothetical protein QO022_32210, partial [Pseudomonas aeruginosa]
MVFIGVSRRSFREKINIFFFSSSSVGYMLRRGLANIGPEPPPVGPAEGGSSDTHCIDPPAIFFIPPVQPDTGMKKCRWLAPPAAVEKTPDSVRQPGCRPCLEMRAFEHPVAAHRLAQ